MINSVNVDESPYIICQLSLNTNTDPTLLRPHDVERVKERNATSKLREENLHEKP